MLKVLHVVGARPNFMKAAPVIAALSQRPGLAQTLVHTGQHYDANMSDIFFRQLGMPPPDVNLEVGSGSHAAQTAQIMLRFEEVVLERRPDVVLVYGDVNSTLAAALVAAKLGIKVGHVEAGLRSFDRTMPEEINRLLTDQIADLLFTPSPDGDANLRREGVPPARIRPVGNCMIDTLVRLLPQAVRPAIEGLDSRFLLVTLHRPPNVDEPAMLSRLVAALADISRHIAVIFPVHPRTRQCLQRAALGPLASALRLTEPLGYLEFLWLQRHATAVVTDSGGIQEETTYLGVPCLTMRENTERPITIEVGTNLLIGRDTEKLKAEVAAILQGNGKRGRIPPLWDGHAGERVADALSLGSI
jgi:UDP-N-acetylglucosamine 2-epimerase (non-hydrolysing)